MIIPVAYIARYGNLFSCVVYNTDTNKFQDCNNLDIANNIKLPIQDYFSLETVNNGIITIVGKNKSEFVVCFGDAMLYTLNKRQVLKYNISNAKLSKDNRIICKQGKMPDLSRLFPDNRIKFIGFSGNSNNSSLGEAKKFNALFSNKRCIIKFSKGNTDDLINEVIYYKISKIINVKVCNAVLTKYGGKPCVASIFEYGLTDCFKSFKNITNVQDDYTLTVEQNISSKIGSIVKSLSKQSEREFMKALILDYLLGQQDRHLSNLAIKNNEFYPLFDNGECLGLGYYSLWSDCFRRVVERWDKGTIKTLVPINKEQYNQILKIIKDKNKIQVFKENYKKLYGGGNT
jgi:hypothetical protein